MEIIRNSSKIGYLQTFKNRETSTLTKVVALISVGNFKLLFHSMVSHKGLKNVLVIQSQCRFKF